MSDENAPLNINSGAEAILGLMSDDRAAVEGDDSPPAQEHDTPTGEPAGPDESPATSDDAGTAEPDASPAIEPPASWASDDKEAFSKLPPDLQQRIAAREAERERAVSQSQRDAAEQRKAAEAEKAQIQLERQQYAQRLQSFIPQLHQAIQGKYANVDWNKLASEDPAQWAALKQQFETDSLRLRVAENEARRVQDQQKQEYEKRVADFVSEQKAELARKRPELAKPEAVQKLHKFLTDEGFTAEDINQLVDHRTFLIVHDAMRFREAQAARAVAADKARVVPKVQRPGADNAGRGADKAADAEAAMSRLRKSGSVNDAALAMRRLGFV